MEKENIESLLHEKRVFVPPKAPAKAHIVGFDRYEEIYAKAEADPEGFWGDRARELLSWHTPFSKVLEADASKPSFKWFGDGSLNVAQNCLDRHVAGPNADKTAIIWQGEPEDDVRHISYRELHAEVCRFANALKSLGVGKGDRVSLYLPMIPELAVAMLACARLGAIHSVVFAGFSSHSLRSRIDDCQAKVVVTADAVLRAGKVIPLKANADEALAGQETVSTCVVVKRAGNPIGMTAGRDVWWHELMSQDGLDGPCEPEPMNAEDILFILYTSGSTGKPKGVVHTTAGYLLYAAHTLQWVFDIQDDDVYWCTADCGWVTGHSYVLYGPLALGATSLMFEGVPSFPQPDRFWKVVDKFKVTKFYTAPTAIRALMREGTSWPAGCELSSLRILGSVGEPINPEAWMWYHENVGKGKLPIVDTWWQTETGGFMLSPLPYATPLKPGSATRPLPGISARIVRADGSPANANEGGLLIIEKPWPGMLRGVFGDPERYKKTYFERFNGAYEAGDVARMDDDGYFWIQGRADDVVNVSGHRLGTAEIESALVSHPAVTEAAAVGMPHAVKGQAIYVYVTLKADVEESEALRAELKKHVRQEIGPIAQPDVIQFAPGLPKTRSGKIMRRVLRKIVEGEENEFGDTSTLADPGVISDLLDGKKRLFS